MAVVIEVEEPSPKDAVSVNNNILDSKNVIPMSSNPGPTEEVLEELEVYAKEADIADKNDKKVFFLTRLILTAGSLTYWGFIGAFFFCLCGMPSLVLVLAVCTCLPWVGTLVFVNAHRLMARRAVEMLEEARNMLSAGAPVVNQEEKDECQDKKKVRNECQCYDNDEEDRRNLLKFIWKHTTQWDIGTSAECLLYMVLVICTMTVQPTNDTSRCGLSSSQTLLVSDCPTSTIFILIVIVLRGCLTIYAETRMVWLFSEIPSIGSDIRELAFVGRDVSDDELSLALAVLTKEVLGQRA